MKYANSYVLFPDSRDIIRCTANVIFPEATLFKQKNLQKLVLANGTSGGLTNNEGICPSGSYEIFKSEAIKTNGNT